MRTLHVLGELAAVTPELVRTAEHAGYAVRVTAAADGDAVLLAGVTDVRITADTSIGVRMPEIASANVAESRSFASPVTANVLGMTLVPVPAGVALDPADTARVRCVGPLLAADFPVTNAMWDAFVAASGYEGSADCPGLDAYRVYDGSYLRARQADAVRFADPALPVVCVSWRNATALAAWLTDEERARGRLGLHERYRLPTETEWEYVCRAGTTSAFWYGDVADDAMMNFEERGGGPTARGVHPPNPWGLFDVHGNVFEWCAGTAEPWRGVPEGEREENAYRVNRGGSWASPAQSCTSRYRHWNDPRACHNRLGVRLVLAAADSLEAHG